MQIGVIGLGRMGGNIARRLMRHGHEAIVHDRDSRAVAALVNDGAIGVAGIDQLVHKLARPRAVWMMYRRARSRKPQSPGSRPCSNRAMSFSMAATRFGRMTSAAQRRSGSATSTMSMSAPAVGFGAWSAATA